MVDTLIRAYDSDLQATDNEGLTPLHVAAGAGRKYIVEKLIKVYKCPVDSNNSDGFTPLAVAAMAGECEIVKVLIGFGANVHFKVKKTNFTVLGIAASLGHTDIVSFLVNNGHCNPCKRDDKGKTALFYACKSNNVSLVETMITEYKCNISAKDDNGMYPLHIAVREGSMEVVQHLVKYHNCDVDIMDNDKNTPLIIAAGTGNSNMVRMLISTLNANINKTNQEGGTAFEFAALNGHEDVVDLFIKDFDTKPQCRGINGRTALHHACNGGHISLVNKLIEVHKCSPTERDWKGVLPLHLAAGSGKVHVVELLVNKHKCDVDCIDTERETPLMYAARRGNNDVVKILITELKAKKDILNYQKLSALDFAVLSHHIETANVLLKLGCDPQPTHAEGMTLLHYACICGEKDFVRQLIHKYKLSVDIADKHKRTPLMLAAQNGECDVVKMLISELNANKNKMDEQDSTALHIAAHSGQMKIVKVLIEQFNCDISSKGFEGKTPLHYACYGGHFELAAKLITEYKCNPHAKDRVGFTPITLAVRVGHADVISALIKYGCPAGLLKVQYKEIERLANKKLSIRPCMKVFVMGDKKVGKSTLIEAVRLFSILKMTSTVKTVPPDTVGIVPVEYNAPFGKIVLYDFAGDKEFHSSHTAVLEKGIGEQIGVFIIVFNLKQYERDKIKERCTIDYWITFLSYACQQYRKSDTYKVNCDSTSTDVVSFSLVGSHSDEVEDASGLLKEVEKYVTKKGTLKDMKLNLRSCIAIDCRMNRSDGLIKLRGILFEAQHNLKIGNKENSITVGSNFLLGVLEKEFRMKGKRVCQVKDLRSTLTSRQLCISFEYSQIDTYLEELYKLSLIFYIKNEMDTSCGWVILDLAILLKDIIGDLLNPESPLYKKKLSKFGIVEEDDLKGITNISTEVVVGCLKHLEFCHEIDIDYIIAAHVQENAGLELPKKKVLFFPALLQVDLSDESDGRVRHDQNDSRQKMKWVLSTQSKEYSIITLGCYECVEQTSEWYFPPRFLHVLLLRLGLGFAEKKRSSEPQNYSFIWKNGIHWSTESVEVVVEVVRNNKGVLMLVRGKSSYEDKQIMQEQVISTMVSVIQEIRAAKSEFCDTLRSVSFIVKLPAEIQTDYIPEIHQFHIFKITEIKNTLTGSNNEENTIYCSCTDHKEEKGTLDQRADEISLLENAKYWDKLNKQDIRMLMKHLKNVIRWKELGLQLGLSPPKLEEIDARLACESFSLKTTAVIEEWKKNMKYPLKEALHEIGDAAIAEDIEKEYPPVLKRLTERKNSEVTDEDIKELASCIEEWKDFAPYLGFSSQSVQKELLRVSDKESAESDDRQREDESAESDDRQREDESAESDDRQREDESAESDDRQREDESAESDDKQREDEKAKRERAKTVEHTKSLLMQLKDHLYLTQGKLYIILSDISVHLCKDPNIHKIFADEELRSAVVDDAFVNKLKKPLALHWKHCHVLKDEIIPELRSKWDTLHVIPAVPRDLKPIYNIEQDEEHREEENSIEPAVEDEDFKNEFKKFTTLLVQHRCLSYKQLYKILNTNVILDVTTL